MGRRKGAKGAVLGVTGGMGSGKTAVVGLFRRRGTVRYSVDRAAHRLYRPGQPAYRGIVRAFGREVLGAGGRINRRTLGETVFGCPGRLGVLERIVHPRLRSTVARDLAWLRGKSRLTVVEAGALLFRLGLDRMVDRILVVTARTELRVRRLRRRDGLPESMIRRRLSVLRPLERQLHRAARRDIRARFLANNGPLHRLPVEAAETVAWVYDVH